MYFLVSRDIRVKQNPKSEAKSDFLKEEQRLGLHSAYQRHDADTKPRELLESRG